LRDLHEARSRDSERIVLFVGDARIVLPELFPVWDRSTV